MKTAVIAFYEVFPPVSGAAVVSHNTAKYLPGERHLLQLRRDIHKTEKPDAYPLTSFQYISDNHLAKALSILWILPKMLKKIREVAPDIILLEGASWTVYYLMFLWYLKINGVKAKYVYHAHNVEYELRRSKNSRIVVWLTKWAERKILRGVDTATAVSEIDAGHFRRLYGAVVMLLPNGVDTQQYEITPEEIKKARIKYHLPGKLVLFMGLTDYKPNKEAIQFLVNSVFPDVIKKDPEIKLIVIGGKVDFHKEWLVNPGSIPFEDVPAVVNVSDLCVSPIISGSGTRLKILEYMAAGKPVLSTPKGAEGLECKDGRSILLASSASEFTEKILELIGNKDLARRIGEEGKKLVKMKYSWPRILGDFESSLLTSRS